MCKTCILYHRWSLDFVPFLSSFVLSPCYCWQSLSLPFLSSSCPDNTALTPSPQPIPHYALTVLAVQRQEGHPTEHTRVHQPNQHLASFHVQSHHTAWPSCNLHHLVLIGTCVLPHHTLKRHRQRVQELATPPFFLLTLPLCRFSPSIIRLLLLSI